MKIVLGIVLAYLIGSVNPAYIFGKLHGFDIRTRGSHNAGASNAKLLLGWKYFIMVCAYDISKAVIAVHLARYVLNLEPYIAYICGCVAVMGHMFPFYLQFIGGKGFASYIGLALCIDFKLFIIIMAVGLILALLTNYIVTATVTLSLALPIVSIIKNYEPALIIGLFVVSFTILFKHRVNAIRLLKGEEIGINGKPIGFKILTDK